MIFRYWFYFKGLFGGVKLAINSDLNKYVYSGYGIEFDSGSEFLLPNDRVGKDVNIFGVDMRSSVHIINKGKDVLFLAKIQTQGLDNTTLSAEAQSSIDSTRSNIKFYLSLLYNGRNSFLFVNDTKIYQFKAKDSEIKIYHLCFGNFSGDSANNMTKKNRIKWMCVRCCCWLYSFW